MATKSLFFTHLKIRAGLTKENSIMGHLNWQDIPMDFVIWKNTVLVEVRDTK